jgi:hypothetical protein
MEISVDLEPNFHRGVIFMIDCSLVIAVFWQHELQHVVYTYVTPRVSWNILGRQLMSAPPRNSSVVELTGDLGSCLVIAKAIGEEWQILVSIGSCFYCWFDVFGGDHNPFCCNVEGSWQVIAVYVCKVSCKSTCGFALWLCRDSWLVANQISILGTN